MDSAAVDPRIARYSKTFTDIRRRMQRLGVALDDFIDDSKPHPVRAWKHPLAGIQFDIRPSGGTGLRAAVTGAHKLEMAITAAKKRGGKAFRPGKVKANPHLPVDVSMLVTDGAGFREIYYFDSNDISDTQRRTASAMPGGVEIDHGFAARFGAGPKRIDISSLHVSVGAHVCGIHVDETGFVFQPLGLTGGDVWVSLDFLQHTVYELLARDIGGMPANIEVYVPNANNAYERAGARATLNLTNQLRVVVDKSVGINLPTFYKTPKEAQFTISLGGAFNGP